MSVPVRSARPSVSRAPGGARDAHAALLAVAIAVTLWGGSAVAIKAVGTTGLVTAFYRLWFAIPPLWVLALVTPAIRRNLDRSWAADCVVGGTLFAVHQLLFFNALKLTTVTNVSLIGALQPALVLLVAGPLFGERTTWRSTTWSAVAFVGAALVILGSTDAPSWSPFGDVLATVNLFAFTAYFLVSKRIRLRMGAWEYVIGMTTVAGVVMTAACVMSGQDFGSPAGWEWAVLAGLAILPGTLGHVLVNWAHVHTSAFVISLMLLAVPVIAAGLAAAALGEVITRLQLAGGAVVLGAIGVVVGSTRQAAPAIAESAAATDAP